MDYNNHHEVVSYFHVIPDFISVKLFYKKILLVKFSLRFDCLVGAAVAILLQSIKREKLRAILILVSMSSR